MLYVQACIKTPAYATPTVADKKEPGAAVDMACNCYLEVIDTKSNVVVASTGPLEPSRAQKEFPSGYFPGSGGGFQYVEDESGETRVRIIDIKLVGAK